MAIKFPIRGLHLKQTMHNLRMAILASIIGSTIYAASYKFPKRVKYKAFYSTYDPIVSFERMADAGFLSSCPPTGNTQKRKDEEKRIKDAAKKKADDKKKEEALKKERAKKG